MEKKLKAAGYARVSTLRDCQDGSFASQQAYLRDFIRRQPGLEFAGVYGDHGKSGRYMKDRQALQELMAAAEAGEVELICCKSLSRFARNMRQCLELVRHLSSLGVGLIFIKEGIDTRTMQGELHMAIMAAVAAAESDSIAENVRHSRRKAVLSGCLWSRPPYGYRCDDKKNWIIAPDEALRIQRLFELAAQGHVYAELRRTLNEMEAAAGTGRLWTQEKILTAIRNEAYVGDYLTHKRILLRRQDGSGRRVTNHGLREQFYLEGHHPAIVSRELFHKVNDLQSRGLLASGKG